ASPRNFIKAGSPSSDEDNSSVVPESRGDEMGADSTAPASAHPPEIQQDAAPQPPSGFYPPIDLAGGAGGGGDDSR
ncbi:unnamed protein product, partial [Ostreobium quekettii]